LELSARTNHKGGTIAFSPIDGMLYWGLGDGGSSDDPDNLAQDPQSLLGKMLRIDVGGGPTRAAQLRLEGPRGVALPSAAAGQSLRIASGPGPLRASHLRVHNARGRYLRDHGRASCTAARIPT
jgi:hypothetical protein